MKVLFAPHSDDETLFAAYTLIRHRPSVVVCFPSERDYGDTAVRTEETRSACRALGAGEVVQWSGGSEAEVAALMRDYDAKFHPTDVWAPHERSSHPHHVTVARAAAAVFGERVTFYHTYEAGQKVRHGRKVEVEEGWPERKRQALRCHVTQRTHPRAKVFFDEQVFDLDEYIDAPAEVETAAVTDVQTPEDGLRLQTPESGAPPVKTRQPRRRKGASGA